jgi:beta-glucosidase-like glycosyl hydrolase
MVGQDPDRPRIEESIGENGHSAGLLATVLIGAFAVPPMAAAAA